MAKNYIYKTVEKACVDADISVAELARRIGTTPANLYKRLGTGKFTYSEFMDIANALGCNFIFAFEPAQAIENP